MDYAAHPPPRRSDDRIILHFDYDCFYAQVVQRRFPGGGLDGRCVGVTQKSLLATCNYEARRRGVRKMMRITEARRICPDMVLVDGEDLTPFRDVSKQLYRLVRDAVGPAAPVERLGLDEVFVDATALVDANYERIFLQPVDIPLSNELFLLSSDGSDEPRGFSCDCTSFAGHVIGDSSDNCHAGPPLRQAGTDTERHARARMRLLLGSQLAAYLRLCLEHEAGYTSSAGIATSKVLSKLAGKVKKPANQTVLVSAVSGSNVGTVVDAQPGLDLDAMADAVVWQFMDELPLRSVPGIGFKTSSLLGGYILAAKAKAATCTDGGCKKRDTNDENADNMDADEETSDESDGNNAIVTVEDVRTFPGMSPRLLDDILSRNNTTGTASAGNIPTGRRVWDLLHGVDDTPVRGGRDLPTQISIEDTFAGPRQGTLRPDAAAAVSAELHKLATSLVRRMHVDLVESPPATGTALTAKENMTDETRTPVWLARPRTLRLTMRPQMPEAVDNRAPENFFARMSRSQPLPGFMLSLTMPPEQIVDRLVSGSLIPMFRKLAASVQVGKRALARTSKPAWTVGLLNVCVANMAPVAGRGGDIATMFMRQDHSSNEGPSRDCGRERKNDFSPDEKDSYETRQNGYSGRTARDCDRDVDGWNTDEDTDEDTVDGTFEVCAQCGHPIATFALEAHARFHSLGD
ncbi:MAG: hypothetical protein SEPTF4163_004967 [Sporothrix epigloea]